MNTQGRQKLLPHLTDEELKSVLEKDYLENLLSITDIAKKYGIDYRSMQKWLRKMEIPIRSKSEGMKLRFAKMTEEERIQHLASARKAFEGKKVAEHVKEKIARTRSTVAKMSRWEKWFAKLLIDNDLYDFRFSVPCGGFVVDFGMMVEKIAVEIDTPWHDTEDSKERDDRKDEYLKNDGWTVLRVRINYKHRENANAVIEKIKELLG